MRIGAAKRFLQCCKIAAVLCIAALQRQCAVRLGEALGRWKRRCPTPPKTWSGCAAFKPRCAPKAHQTTRPRTPRFERSRIHSPGAPSAAGLAARRARCTAAAAQRRALPRPLPTSKCPFATVAVAPGQNQMDVWRSGLESSQGTRTIGPSLLRGCCRRPGAVALRSCLALSCFSAGLRVSQRMPLRFHLMSSPQQSLCVLFVKLSQLHPGKCLSQNGSGTGSCNAFVPVGTALLSCVKSHVSSS